MKRAAAVPFSLAGVREIRIAFDTDHLPSNVTVEFHDGSTLDTERLYNYEPKPFPGSPLYQAYEAIFGGGKELRVQTWLALPRAGGAR